MFDFRYHLVSLAAVFIALAVGILLGAAISGKLSDAEDALTKSRLDSLNDALAQERTHSANAERRSRATTQLVEDAYPVLMENRLEGRGFALLFLGPVSGDIRSAVERTLADAGSGTPVRLVAVDTPVDPKALDGMLAGNDELAHFAKGGDDFGDLGEALGRELIEGNGTPLWGTLSSELVQERSGATSPVVDGAVVVRSWAPPADSGDVDQQAETRATETLFEGLLRGMGKTGLPVVGVETTTSDQSAVGVYSSQGASSVDDVDTTIGRLALAVLLADGRPGHYGVKDSAADGVVPPIEAVVTTGG